MEKLPGEFVTVSDEELVASRILKLTFNLIIERGGGKELRYYTAFKWKQGCRV